MSKLLRVCLYNTEKESSGELTAHIQAMNFVRLIGEVSCAESLATTLQSSDVNLVFFHLDPDASAVVDVIEQVSGRFPDLALVALSHQTNPRAILAPMRAGCDQFVCEPIDHVDLTAAIARVASKRSMGEAKSRCICVTGSAGGVGTTSIASNLALEIGDLTDRQCALIDMDFQFGDLAINFDTVPRYTFHDLACAGSDLDKAVLTGSLAELPCNVALLARPEQISQSESITPETVHRVIELLKATHENIVIDLPVQMDGRSLAAFSQADTILIVCQLLVPNIRNAKRYFDALVAANVPDDRIQVVINRGDSGGGRVSSKNLEETFKKPVFATIPSDYAFVAQSLDFGQPIASAERKNPVRTAIRDIARRIAGDPTEDAGANPARRGFFGRLLAK